MLCRKRKDRTSPARADSSVGGESCSSFDSSNSTPSWKYHVFLSFRGKDTRLKFTDHLYEAFKTSGILTFRDDTDLERGGHIQQDLPQAIEDSLCAVVIISGNYADSTWCLDELQKILESASTLNRRVFPIFYDVDPADVRNQRNSYGKALAEHEKKFGRNTTKVQKWRDALSKIANMSGSDTRGKHEADLIKDIVGKVWTYLSSKLPSCGDNLVGIDSRVSDMMPLLEVGLDDKRFVGVWGMGGLGKTTLARVVSEKISPKFEIYCFLGKVRETLSERGGLVSLQKRLLSHLKIKDMEIPDDYEGMKVIRRLLCNKKVLLVLDDVVDMSQLKNLAESPDWFGKGSRIIITTRERHLLTASGAQRIYEMKSMEEDESLQLFSKKAFKKDYPGEAYLELSKSVVKYSGGLPLALQAMGSYLCGRSEQAVWRDALEKLKQTNAHRNTLEVLKISYDGLDEKEQMIFLDIVCFFKGRLKKEVTRILKDCDLNPIIGIQVLIEKTLLVETKYSTLDMHDLYEDLGWDLIKKNYPNSRLWKFEDIKEVLENNKGSDAIQAISMQYYHKGKDTIEVHPEAFSKMGNIRLLLINPNSFYHHPIIPRGIKLSGALKVVQWEHFPLEAFPLETPLDKLVHIQMGYSKIKQLWNGRQSMRMLKYINLSDSRDLTETPDFSGVPHLEYLCLHHCESLVKVHPSIGKLKKLVELDLSFCFSLEILPTELETDSLMKLNLPQCLKVAVLPEFGEGMKKLSHLDVSDTPITTLPESLRYLTGLECLELSVERLIDDDGMLFKPNIGLQIIGFKLTSLTELFLMGCGLDDRSIPDDFGCLPSLIVLDLSLNNFVNLPTNCFSSLSQLLFLSLRGCNGLKSLPRLPPRLVRLEASDCKSMEAISSNGDQLWDLVTSLDHEHRGRTTYAISDDVEEWDDSTLCEAIDSKNSQAQWVVPLRDFYAIIPGSEIPSWFPNKEYYSQHGYMAVERVIEVEIPTRLRYSEWSGIVVCLAIGLVTFCGEWLEISWSSKAAKDDDNYIFKQWAHTFIMSESQLCMMVLELNKETCWQHLGGPNNNNSLHIKLSISKCYVSDWLFTVRGCGWRVIRKEEIQRERCNNNHSGDLKQLTTHPQFDDEIKLPVRVLERFITRTQPCDWWHIQDLESSGEEEVASNDSL